MDFSDHTCVYDFLACLRYLYVHLSNAGHVKFSLRCLAHQNNSLVTLEDIGDSDNALLCMTDRSACCRHPAIGNWFFPSGVRVPGNGDSSGDLWRTRGHMVVQLNRIGGGKNGIYRCEIPDAMNVTQTLYIGVYRASTGEWYVLFIIGDCRVILVRSPTYCTYSDKARSLL